MYLNGKWANGQFKGLIFILGQHQKMSLQAYVDNENLDQPSY